MKKEELYRIKLVSVLGFLLAIFLAFNISAFAVEESAVDEPLEGEVIETEIIVEEPAVTSNNLAEPEELLDDYIEVLTKEYAESHDAVSFEAKDGIIPSKLRGAKLTGADKAVYDYLKERIEEVARGENIDVTNEDYNGLVRFTVPYSDIYSAEALATHYTADDLGLDAIVVNDEISDDVVHAIYERYTFDMRKVLVALLCDYPYQLFWFDKTVGVFPDSECIVGAQYNNGEWEAYCSPDESMVTLYFAVSMDYAPDNYSGHDFNGDGQLTPIQTDTEKIKSLSIAVENAMEVVTDASKEKTDYDKLDFYREWICDEVEYNDAAMKEDWDYGDPWQLINVFDGDASTNVVCEGYSKAFKYLCDLTDGFDDTSIDCRLVSGVMAGGTGAGDHMWNVLEIGGKNYLVDVTNCDEGTVGAARKLFMVGNSNATTAQVTEYGRTVTSQRYIFNNLSPVITYTYDVDTVNSFDKSERQLSDTDYPVEPKCNHFFKIVQGSANDPTCTESGKEVDRKCSICGEDIHGAKIRATGHDYGAWTKLNAEQHRRVCKHDATHVEKENHKWDAGKVTKQASVKEEGIKTYTCTVCKAAKTESIPKLKKVAVPVVKTLTYNTKTQTGVAAGEGYTLSGTKSATNAGSYTATASLKSGYVWNDGTTGAKKISWKIDKAPISKASVAGIANRIYTGKVITQSPTLKFAGKTLKNGADYKLSYKNNKNVGRATVAISGKGNYRGSINKTFNINPKGTSLKKVTALKRGMTVYWNRQTAKMSTARITGYQIQISTSANFKKNAKLYTVKGYKNASKKITGLKAKTKYYVHIRTYWTVKISGKKINFYSGWSGKKAVATKK